MHTGARDACSVGDPKCARFSASRQSGTTKPESHFSESDISGLHIEAETLEEFENELFDVAAELIAANHLTEEDLSASPRDVIPAILYRGAPDKVA